MDKESIKKLTKEKNINEYYKKKVLNDPSIRAILNERSKASYRKKKEEKVDGILKKRGRPLKQPSEKLPRKPRGRPIAIKPSA
jgi:hypothetical protein